LLVAQRAAGIQIRYFVFTNVIIWAKGIGGYIVYTSHHVMTTNEPNNKKETIKGAHHCPAQLETVGWLSGLHKRSCSLSRLHFDTGFLTIGINF
jgi:hypothetical protein